MRRECDLAGTRLTDKHYLVGPARGGFLTPNTLGKQWKTLSESLDLVGMEAKRVTFHDLRHAFATTANAAGIDLPTIAHIMGHSTTYVTSLVYVSVDPDEAAAPCSGSSRSWGLPPLDVGCGMTRGELRGAARAVFGFPEAA